MASVAETSMPKSSPLLVSKTVTERPSVSGFQRSVLSKLSVQLVDVHGRRIALAGAVGQGAGWRPLVRFSLVGTGSVELFVATRLLARTAAQAKPVRPLCGAAESAPWLGTQVGENRQHAPVILGRGRQAELGEDARHVLLDRTQRDHHSLGDRLIRAALGHQLQHLAL